MKKKTANANLNIRSNFSFHIMNKEKFFLFLFLIFLFSDTTSLKISSNNNYMKEANLSSNASAIEASLSEFKDLLVDDENNEEKDSLEDSLEKLGITTQDEVEGNEAKIKAKNKEEKNTKVEIKANKNSWFSNHSCSDIKKFSRENEYCQIKKLNEECNSSYSNFCSICCNKDKKCEEDCTKQTKFFKKKQ